MTFIGDSSDVAQFVVVTLRYSRILWRSITIINRDSSEVCCVIDATSLSSGVILRDHARSYSLRLIDTSTPNTPDGSYP